MLDAESRFLYVNKALLDLWGLPLADAIGKNFFDLHYPADLAAKLHDQVRAVFKTRLPLADETPYTNPAGLTGYYEYIFNPVFAEDGTVEMIAGTTRDITGRRRRELNVALIAEIQKVLAPLSSPAEILRLVGRLIAEHMDLTHCLFVQVNESEEEVTVLYDHCAPGERNLAGVYRLDQFHTAEDMRQMAAGGTLLIDDVGNAPRTAGMAAHFRELGIGSLANASCIIDGRWKFVLSAQKGGPYRWTQEDGELLSQLAARLYLRLERAWSEERLRESEERFRRTFENAGIGIAHVSLEGRWLITNKAMGDILGYTACELSAMTFADVTHPDDVAYDLAQVDRIISGEISNYCMEKRYIRKDGATVWGNLTVTLLRDTSGKPLYFISAVEDITAKKAVAAELRAAKESAETANRSKDRFLAVLSHELRTPLAPILMAAAELRTDDRLPGEVRDELAMIERNVALEARLIDDLLDISKIANGKLTMRSQLCDAHALISMVVEMVRSDAQKKQIRFHLGLNARVSSLKGDPARLQQVFWNLLRNAVKFSPAGGQVSVRSFDEQGGGDASICIEVADEGVGFEQSTADTLFQPFEQGKSGPLFGGLGLGLAIARGVVELHGGKIGGRSDGTGRGAIFTVSLPVYEAPAGECASPENDAAANARSAVPEAPPMRLLLVEDHEPTMLVLSRLLTRAGHRVVTAGTVKGALEAAAGETFDLVISDIGLPDGTGMHLMQQLCDMYGLRGIALTGYGTDEDLRQTVAAGFVAHLVKPVDFEDLRGVLRGLAVR